MESTGSIGESEATQQPLSPPLMAGYCDQLMCRIQGIAVSSQSLSRLAGANTWHEMAYGLQMGTAVESGRWWKISKRPTTKVS